MSVSVSVNHVFAGFIGALVITATPAVRSPVETKIAGSAELTYSTQHAAPVPDVPGHILLVGETRGTNRSSDGKYFADAPVVNVEHADLTQGTGQHWGYYTMSKGPDTVVAKWGGAVTTTMKGDQPQTKFMGTWEYVKGTGAYASIRGKGTYEGHFLAKDRYLVQWRGSYTK